MREIQTVQTSLIEGIISRTEYLDIYKELNKKNLVLISISEPSHDGYDDEALTDSEIQGFDDVLRTKFWDIEEDFANYKIISDKEAKEIKDFILKNKDKRFLIHCRAGQSRSAGVGMALECLINNDGNKYNYSLNGSDISLHRRYSPNLTVYDKVVGE